MGTRVFLKTSVLLIILGWQVMMSLNAYSSNFARAFLLEGFKTKWQLIFSFFPILLHLLASCVSRLDEHKHLYRNPVEVPFHGGVNHS